MSKLTFNKEIHFEYGVLKPVVPGVRRLVANNPSPFTYKGTNTYIIGEGDVALIDPGPNLVNHRNVLLAALKGERITHIFLTHTHLDHSAGLAALQHITGAETLGFKLAETDQARLRGNGAQPTGKEFIDQDFRPTYPLKHGDIIHGKTWQLEAIHTPGHAPDHMCYAFVDQKVLFSGDQVMAWNTSVVAPPEGNMGDYIRSLEKLLERDEETYFPGHGGRITTPKRVVKAYIVHRLWRESAILDCVKRGYHSIADITSVVYADVEPHLITACQLSVQAHLEYLIERDKVAVATEANSLTLQTKFLIV